VTISPSATHQIVQDYLKYYGYGDTLQAFDQAAGLTEPAASTSGRYTFYATDLLLCPSVASSSYNVPVLGNS